MAEDDTSDPARRRSNAEADASDRERQERLVYAFAELEGVFELVEADEGNDRGDVARALAAEVEAVRKRLTFEPETIADGELRELVQRIRTDLLSDSEPTDVGSD